MKNALRWTAMSLLCATLGVGPAIGWAEDKMDGDAKTETKASAPTSEAGKKAQATIDKAIAFLKTKQQADGGWAGEHEPPAMTAIVLQAFMKEPKYDAEDAFLEKAFDRLLSFQQPNGGIYDKTLANYSTAISISAIAASKEAEYQAQLEKALAFLKSLQWTDKIEGVEGESGKAKDDKDANFGGWGYGKKGRADGSNMQMALDALHDAGLPESDPAFQAALKFATRMQNRSESNDQPWSSDDGGFVYTPSGGSPDGTGESPAGEYKGADGKRMLRSYGSMTYAGLKSMIYAGLKKDDPRVKAAWEWISKNWTLDENPGMSVADPKQAGYGLYYFYMTVGRALTAYGEPTITDAQGKSHDWRIELIDKVTSLQKEDGSWMGDGKWMENNPTLVTSYCIYALQSARDDLAAHPPK